MGPFAGGLARAAFRAWGGDFGRGEAEAFVERAGVAAGRPRPQVTTSMWRGVDESVQCVRYQCTADAAAACVSETTSQRMR